MRSLLAFVCSTAPLVAQTAENPPTKRQVGELIETYLARDSTAEQRADARDRLRQAAPALATTPLRTALRDDAARARALELAVDLGVEGLWASARPHIDGPDEDLVVRYGLALSERGADREILARWKTAERASTTYGIASAALNTWPIGLPTIEELKRYLDAAEDDRKADDAKTILCFQLGIPAGSAERLEAHWDELITTYEVDAKRFRRRGEDLLRGKHWENTGPISRIGPNYRLGLGAWMTLPAPDRWNEGDMTVLVRARPLAGTGTSVGLGTVQGTWQVRYEAGRWSVRSGRQVEYFVEAKHGEWVTIKFVVRDDNEANTRLARRCSIFVDDEVLMKNGELNGEFEHILIHTDESSAVVGGIEVIQQ